MFTTAEQSRKYWKIYEDFKGYVTKWDPSSNYLKGGSPIGQNTNTENDVITNRPGSELISFLSTTSPPEPIISQWTFHKRDGSEIELRSHGTVLEFRYPGTLRWSVINFGYTPNKIFGHAECNVNADNNSYDYSGNAVDQTQRWTGAIALFASNTATTITIQGTKTLAELGFIAAGAVLINGIQFTYTGISGQTFTGVAVLPPGMVVGDPMGQKMEFYLNVIPTGNIFSCQGSRLFVSGVKGKESTLFWSHIDDPTNFTFGSPRKAGEGGAAVTPEGGGAILGIIQDEEVIYVIKSALSKTLTFQQSQVSSMDDFPVFAPFKSFDNKSQQSGAYGQRLICSGANGWYFVNQNKEMFYIARAANIDYPQSIPISDPIRPTLLNADITDGVMIFHENKLHLTCKTSSSSTFKDLELVYDTVKQVWYDPYIGRNINDYNIQNNELHWGSAVDTTSYRQITDKLDNGNGFTANWRSWEENFGSPSLQKKVDFAFVEGYISDNTILNVNIYLDDNGYSGIIPKKIRGDSTIYIFFKAFFNLFGLNPFGIERFGSNKEFSKLKKFRVYIPIKDNQEIFTIQIEFLSEGKAQEWQVTRFGYRLREETLMENLKLQIV